MSETGDTTSQPDPSGRFAGIAVLFRFAAPATGRLICSVLLAIAATVLELAPLVLLYLAIDGLVAGTAGAGDLTVLAILAAVSVAGRFALWSWAMYVSHLAAFDVIRSLRTRMADHLSRVPLGFVTGRHSGEFKKVMVEDAQRLELFLAHAIPEAVSAFLTWLAFTLWMLAVDWRLALAAAIVVPIGIAFLRVAMRGVSERLMVNQQALGRVNAAVVEELGSVEVVKAFVPPGARVGDSQEAIDAYAEAEIDSSLNFSWKGSPFYTLVVSNSVVAIPVGLLLYQAGSIGITDLLFFYVLSIGYGIPLLRCYRLAFYFKIMISAAGFVRGVLDLPLLPDTGQRLSLTSHDVEFRSVSFSYDSASASTATDRMAIRDVSLLARSGEVTALVGPSGAGKTTLARLVPRFWDVDSGAVLIGGVDVREQGVDELMDTVSFVFQETFLFHDTVAANVAFGSPNATRDQLIAAAKAAQAHEFVERLPQGYDSVVGQRGQSLSGGECQRLAIARAILKDAPVLVLDEATAFADPDNETEIQNAISALAAGRTLLVIAHRLGTIRNADHVVVVDAGRVVGAGRHDDLIGSCAVYAQMWADHLELEGAALGHAVHAVGEPAR